jgi:hypothetical protein
MSAGLNRGEQLCAPIKYADLLFQTPDIGKHKAIVALYFSEPLVDA